MKPISYKVFISSTQKDSDLARDLARRLESAGVSVVSVDETRAGAQFKAAIDRSLREADELVLIVSPDSVNSPSLMFEMGAAFFARKRVTPVLVGIDPSELPTPLKYVPSVKYSDLQDYISEIGKRTAAPQPEVA